MKIKPILIRTDAIPGELHVDILFDSKKGVVPQWISGVFFGSNGKGYHRKNDYFTRFRCAPWGLK